MTLVQIYPPSDYYPKKIDPKTPKSQRVLSYIKANFDKYELWPYQEFERLIKGTLHPFVAKRHLGVLWAHGYLEKWVEGEWSGARGNSKAPKRRIEVELGEEPRKVGKWHGVHYKWVKG